jgi:hypothetical protein
VIKPASARAFVGDLFHRHGWQVDTHSGPDQPDLVVAHGHHRYAIELKLAGESRKDRVIPLVSQAILQARSSARAVGAHPLVVILAPPMSPLVVNALFRFTDQYAEDVAIGVIDIEGFSRFSGDGLDALDMNPAAKSPRSIALQPSRHLFSDLNQWMLKVLLAPRIPDHLLNAPRSEYRNVSELAKAATVSVMSAFRFQQQLLADGFLDEHAAVLRLVRLPELFRQWQASYVRPPRDLPMQWLLGRPSLHDMLRHYEAARHDEEPRACLGLFAAAEALDLGFVHGVPPHLYLERVSSRALERLGLRSAGPGQQPDVFVRVARPRESLFRCAVKRDDVLASDVLQVWLDVANYPARGAEQADHIRRSALSDLFTS